LDQPIEQVDGMVLRKSDAAISAAAATFGVIYQFGDLAPMK
jgi:hypothetical protein